MQMSAQHTARVPGSYAIPVAGKAAPGTNAASSPDPTLSVFDCFSNGGAARRSYPLLLVSLLGTALQFWIGMAAIYELSGNRVMDLQSWAWLVTSQCIYAAVLWVTCYSCVSSSFISPGKGNNANFMHPYTRHLMNYLFVTGMQTTLVWVMYTSMDSDDRSLFDDYRYTANKPIGYNTDYNMFWYVQLYGFTLAMVGAIMHLTGSWKYETPGDDAADGAPKQL